jgi:cytochrome c oxidase subunit 4
MTDHSHAVHSSAAGHDHGHGGLGKYIAVFVTLCILTALSFGVASTPWIMETPAVGWAIMMAVSCMKALLVIAFFMHLIWEANWKYVLTIPASIMSLFLVLMLVPDIKYRTWHYSSERWEAAAPKVETPIGHGDHHEAPRLPYTKADLEKSTQHKSQERGATH